MIRLRYAIPAITILLLSHAAVAQTTINSTNGTWSLYPALAESYQTQVNQPINADGTSNFPAKRGVIPVSFSLFTGTGSVLFESIGSDTDTSNDYSYLDFTPNKSFTLGQISNLIASYSFTEGNCHGGSLRWSMVLKDGTTIFVYYGNDNSQNPIGTDCQTLGQATNQSGMNMIDAKFDPAGGPDTRYEINGRTIGGQVYITYAQAVANAGTSPVQDIVLVVESGWQTGWTDYNGATHNSGDQIINLMSAQIQTSVPTSDTFTPPSSTPTQTCTLPTAQIQVIKTSGSNPGTVNEVVSQSAADTTGYFRVVDCKYMYNLDVSSLLGAGGYTVEAVINNMVAGNPAKFLLK